MLVSRIRNTNTDGKPFSFTFAYHTYFYVSDVRFVNLTCYLARVSPSKFKLMVVSEF